MGELKDIPVTKEYIEANGFYPRYIYAWRPARFAVGCFGDKCLEYMANGCRQRAPLSSFDNGTAVIIDNTPYVLISHS